jgi:hypothetical protein
MSQLLKDKDYTFASNMADVKASTPGMATHYNERSQGQYSAFQHFWPWLADALGDCTLKQSGVISYADYGCSGGANAAKQFVCLKTLLEDMHVFAEVRWQLTPRKFLRVIHVHK